MRDERAAGLKSKRLIGEILVETAGLTPEMLAYALGVQREKGGRLGEILVQKQAISESALLAALAVQFDCLFLEKLPATVSSAFVARTPLSFLKKYKMLPLEEEKAVVVSDPTLFQPVDDLCRLLGWRSAAMRLAPAEAILATLSALYDVHQGSAEQVIQDMRDEDTQQIISEIEGTGDLLDDTSDAPIVKFVNLMLSQAVRAGASDIHVEPYQESFKIRYRVDGILYDMFSPPRHIQSALVSRIKIMAKLNIAEKRLPQDGRIEIRIGDKNVDLRVSTIPTAHGERVVLRLLDKSNVVLRLTSLGMSEAVLASFNRLIKLPHGIILVTGPTGSGKTTTLYAGLSAINSAAINILTIEDPVEYRLEGIGQMQVNSKIDLTFARGLRSLVRQDPDVILVGEIRDLETAQIAIQSALTGHLVFSTLHTNDSASAVTRLVDMGIESFLVTSSVVAILAQRLVRVLCTHCKEEYQPSVAALAGVGITTEMAAGHVFYREKGCPACLNTGYRGRIGIYELMMMSESVKSSIIKSFDANIIQRVAMEQGMVTLRQDGVRKVCEGITSIEEVLRVTQ
ncbi:MAG: type II secretion system ATPase GspE [Desulfobulbaceae bacterium]|nr:type II secretion system ATPase GspE [Desulfobulbaceae bacterium]